MKVCHTFMSSSIMYSIKHPRNQAAGLEIISEVLSTEAVLVASHTSRHREMVEIIRKRLLGYMTATKLDTPLVHAQLIGCSLMLNVFILHSFILHSFIRILYSDN
jgi:hypothetical protein